MPDASQFTQLKKYNAISARPVPLNANKAGTHLYQPISSATTSTDFLATLTNKYTNYMPTYTQKNISTGVQSKPKVPGGYVWGASAGGIEGEAPPGYARVLEFSNSGTPSYVQVSPKASLFTGSSAESQPFSVSFFLKATSAGGIFSFSKRKFTGPLSTQGAIYFLMAQITGSNPYNLRIGVTNSGTQNAFPINIDYTSYMNEWHFINITGGSASGIVLEIDGTQIANNSTPYFMVDPNDGTTSLDIGSVPINSIVNSAVVVTQTPFGGYLTNFRWVVGSALSITPTPSPPLPVIPGQTSLLLSSRTSATAFSDSGTDSENTSITFVGPTQPARSIQLIA